MSNPFKKLANKAKETKNEAQWKDTKTTSNINTKTCDSCGAPRQKNTNLTTCNYCGTKFMSIDTIIKADD